jgi:lysyl-tRNA synthetase class 2
VSGAGADWRPGTGVELLRRRAELLQKTRAFFAERGVLEVETPLLGSAAVTDIHIESLRTRYTGPGAAAGRELWLQTSPEYAMKRLLAAGSGPIYQIARAFRDGESGPVHNPEFTLLEWYRPGLDHHALMDEVDLLLAALLQTAPAQRLSYAAAFSRHVGLDPHRASDAELVAAARQRGLGSVGLAEDDRDGWLALLLTHALEPRLSSSRPTFLYDFPASQAALARIRPGAPPLAERFEVYVGGLELANGYHELLDHREQRARFERDLERRRERGLSEPPVDERLLEALRAGLPACSGVALGFDRLVLIAAGCVSLSEVVPFTVDRA